jgi:hypothetical protein
VGVKVAVVSLTLPALKRRGFLTRIAAIATVLSISVFQAQLP